jgi:hypothetical protein
LGACYIPHVSSYLDIWFSPWIPTLPNFHPIPRVSRLIMEHPLAISDLIHLVTLTWNVSLLYFLFDSFTVPEVLKIPIRTISDALLWIALASGIFTTKTAHHLYTSFRPPPVSPVTSISWKGLWKLKLNHRLKLFLWKMVWNIVPTKDRISQSITTSQLDSSCSLCSNTTDSLFHLFFSCPIAQAIWRNSFWPLDITALRISAISDWLNITLHPGTIGISSEDSHLFQIFALVACDLIWHSHNKAHHDSWIPNALSISATVNRTSRIHFTAWKNKIALVQQVWIKPDPFCFKINYDTAIRKNFSAQAAVVGILLELLFNPFQGLVHLAPLCMVKQQQLC